MAALTTQNIVDAGTKPTLVAAAASDTAEIGNQISAVIRNKGAAAIEFSAGFVGTIAK